MKLELTLNEINLILQTLSQAPYASVFQLIEKVKQQAEAQVKESKTEDAA